MQEAIHEEQLPLASNFSGERGERWAVGVEHDIFLNLEQAALNSFLSRSIVHVAFTGA